VSKHWRKIGPKD